VARGGGGATAQRRGREAQASASVGGGAEAGVQCLIAVLGRGQAPAGDGAWPGATARRPACPLRV